MENNNQNIAKSPSLTRALLPLIVILVVQTLVSFFLEQILVFYEAMNYTGGKTYIEFLNEMVDISSGSVFTYVTLIAYAVVCFFWFGSWYQKEFLLTEKTSYSMLVHKIKDMNLAYLVAGILLFTYGMQELSNYLVRILGFYRVDWMKEYDDVISTLDTSSVGSIVAIIIYGVFLGPIVEELAFRGISFGIARKRTGFWFANFFQAALFGCLHANVIQGLYSFGIGLFLGYFFEKSQNIIVTMLLHICFNLFGVFMSTMLVSGDSAISFFVGLMLGMICTYGGIIFLKKSINNQATVSDI